jgi:SAM-dependent methyltransferase
MSSLRNLLRPLKRRWEENRLKGRSDFQLAGRWQLPSLLNARQLMGTGVEVGVYEGWFSGYLLENWRGNKLISVDPWRHFETGYVDECNQKQAEMDRIYATAAARLKGFGPRSDIWRMLGEEAAAKIPDGTLDFVYIDAQHHYEAVKADMALWYSKVKPGGLLAGHDYMDGSFPFGEFGVKSAVDEFVRERQLRLHVTGEKDSPSWLLFKA